MKTTQQGTFECALCHRTFETEWSDADAQAEYERAFGRTPTDEDDAVVCDDCYRGVMG